MSVVIIKGKDIVYSNGFGFADVENKRPVTKDTFFELGSTSKAYTALAVLKLVEKGKINLKESVDSYIPWLTFTHKDSRVSVTIEQLLHHTSGVPFQTIDDIPVSDENDALEKTVRGQHGRQPQFYVYDCRGTKHSERHDWKSASRTGK